MTCLGTIEPFSKAVRRPTSMKNHSNGVPRISSFIDKDHWPLNSPDLNPLDYCVWNEIAQAIKWNAVTSKKALIVALKRAVKKISNDVVFESCLSWTNRLYRMSQDKGYYLK